MQRGGVMSCGLVLDGGGMRSVYVSGVLDAFLDHGIRFTDCVAVADGALNAASYLPGQRTRAYKAYTKFLGDARAFSMKRLLQTGSPLGYGFLYGDVSEQLVPLDYQGFRRAGCKITVALTNCKTGKAEYHVVNDLWAGRNLLRAAVALPGVSRMVPIGEELYLDGSIANPIPVQYALRNCFSKAVVILTREENHRRAPARTLPMLRLKFRKFPALLGAMNYRHVRYNRTRDHLAAWQEEGRVFVICPTEKLKPARLGDKQNFSAMYNAGVRDGVAAIPRLRAFLSAPEPPPFPRRADRAEVSEVTTTEET